MKYGLLVYQYLYAFHKYTDGSKRFHVITHPWNDVEVYPFAPPLKIEDGVGQTMDQWPQTCLFKIVEWNENETVPSGETTPEDAITQARNMWNESEANQIPEEFQLIFTQEEAGDIRQIFVNLRQALGAEPEIEI